MNTEGNNASSFGVPYQIQGLWQYLETLKARKAYNPPEEVSPRVNPLKEWLLEVKHYSEAI